MREQQSFTEEREMKLRVLREILDASIAKGGRMSDGALEKVLKAKAAELVENGW
jgi:antitoxin ParD1/3/4